MEGRVEVEGRVEMVEDRAEANSIASGSDIGKMAIKNKKFTKK